MRVASSTAVYSTSMSFMGGTSAEGSSKDPPDDGLVAPETEAPEEMFLEGLRQRGEVVAPVDLDDEELAPGVTHVVVDDEEGKPVVQRRRFSSS